MKHLMISLASFLLFAIPILLWEQEALAINDDDNIVEFEAMFGVDGPFLGDFNNPIREVNGGGLPWVLESAQGELKANGALEIEVEGLIIPESAGFGFNPAPFFLAAVSCLTSAGELDIENVNLFTTEADTVMVGDPRNGNATITANLALPTPCVAPIIFVTSPGGAWFSATGQ